MYLTGFTDEAAKDIDGQIRATQALGWKNIEAREVDGVNLVRLPQRGFDRVCEKLGTAGIHINCFGSAIANWATKLSDPPEQSYNELRAAIPRMQRLGTKLIRIMSFNIPVEESLLDNEKVANEIIKRIGELARIAEDGGVTLVHENCNNWGGRSYEHALRLLDSVHSPALKLVFDTGNPVFEKNVRGKPPYAWQNSLEFYNHVKEHIAYIHIKDGRMEKDKMVFTHAGEGDGHVPEILADLHASGYDGGISIEPHMAVVHHDKSAKSDDNIRFENYVEYGRRVEKMVRELGWKPE